MKALYYCDQFGFIVSGLPFCKQEETDLGTLRCTLTIPSPLFVSGFCKSADIFGKKKVLCTAIWMIYSMKSCIIDYSADKPMVIIQKYSAPPFSGVFRDMP